MSNVGLTLSNSPLTGEKLTCERGEGKFSDLVALVGFFPDGTGAEKGISIAHLVGTLHRGRRSNGEDRVVDELDDMAAAVLFAGQTGMGLVTFRRSLFNGLLYLSFDHGSAPVANTRGTNLFYRITEENLESAISCSLPDTRPHPLRSQSGHLGLYATIDLADVAILSASNPTSFRISG